MKLYHYTKQKNIESILKTGLKAHSNYKNMNADLRLKVLYAWLFPEHDVMGYSNDDDYVLLELEVDEARCIVANMDYISAAYVNSKVGNDGGKELSIMMTNEYEESSVLPKDYINGLFRTPEVIVKGDIQPPEIRIVKKTSKTNNNIIEYSKRMEEHVLYRNMKFSIEDISKWNLRLVAVHDDSTGILGTFKDKERDAYITVVLSEESQGGFIDYFFSSKKRS